MADGPPASFLYFGYGSNLLAPRLHESCPSARLLGPARLDGYRLAFTLRSERWGGGVADVRPDPAGAVWGAVWRIDEREGAVLDRQEGVHRSPPRYRRLEVSVATPSGEQLACLAYQVGTPAAEHVAPSASYLETVLAGARAAGLSADYVAHIAALGARP